MLIRPARVEDSAEACAVMRRSITELCSSDHQDDPAILRQWVANKTPDVFRSWIADRGNRVLVAVEGEAILAVGAVKTDGEITLNYVSPDAQFRGISAPWSRHSRLSPATWETQAATSQARKRRGGFIYRRAIRR